jgi:formate-dependent nitrite reductase membrane component NrfD
VSWTDGRLIDERRGILEGEGSHQKIRQSSDFPATPTPDTYRHVPGVDAADPTYYGQAILKQPVWIWTIPTYLYIGGVAGASATLGAAAHAMEGRKLHKLVTHCRWTATVGAVLSTACLIHDLGRPMRFLYMLRVFRPSSPMSVGSWVLTGFGGAAAGSAVLPGALGTFAGGVAGLLGMPLASYTSVLLSHTAVPLWQESRRTMPFLFIGSAISAAAALLEFGHFSHREERVITAFAVAGSLMELAGVAALEHEAARVEQVAKPLREGATGALWTTAKVLSAASLVLALVPGKSRKVRVLSGIAGTLASLAVRFAIFHAGKRSAADPRATFHLQRADIGQ